MKPYSGECESTRVLRTCARACVRMQTMRVKKIVS